MVVAADGTAYVGNFGFELGTPRQPAALARVQPDGAVDVVADGLEFPNGTVITPDGRTLIVGESMGKRATAFTIDGDGTLRDRRLWADLGAVLPDGCTLDAEGAIWFADAGGTAVVRVREGGEVTDRIEAGQPTFACTLGGDDGRTLFVVCADRFGEADDATTRRPPAPSARFGSTIPHAGPALRGVGVPALPSGTVTFLFTDIEGSTRLWEEHPEAMKAALARHDAILVDAVVAHGGDGGEDHGRRGPRGVRRWRATRVAAALDGQLGLVREPWGATGPISGAHGPPHGHGRGPRRRLLRLGAEPCGAADERSRTVARSSCRSSPSS